jgi:hypothetical protein
VRVSAERLDVQRLSVLPVDPVANAAQPREVAQMLLCGGSAGHLRDRATSPRSCLMPLASPTPRPLCPVCFSFKAIEFVEEAYELKGREQDESTAMLLRRGQLRGVSKV